MFHKKLCYRLVRPYDVTVIAQSKSYVKLWYELLFFGLLNIRSILEDLKKLALFFGFTCKFVFFLGCWKNKLQNCKSMKSFYRSSIQLGFSNLKKVRLKSYLFTHTQFLPLVNYLEPKWHKCRLNSKCRYFLGFKFDLEISSNEHPCLNPPPRVRFNFVTRIFPALCTRQFQAWPSPGVRSGKPPGTFLVGEFLTPGQKEISKPRPEKTC